MSQRRSFCPDMRVHKSFACGRIPEELYYSYTKLAVSVYRQGETANKKGGVTNYEKNKSKTDNC